MTTAIRCGFLIDGTGAVPTRGATVVVENDTIVAVNANGDIPRNASVIDAAGLTVMPGLIDAHVHLAMWPQSLQEGLLTPFTLRMARALVHCRETLEAGVTSARDASGLPRGVKQAIDQGLFPGPRLKISVKGLHQTGGHGDSTFPSGANTSVINAELPNTTVDGVEQVRKAVREVIRAGADVVKVATSGGVMSPASEVGATGFSPEEIAVIVYEAHAAGKPVMAHAQPEQGIKNAVLGGIDSIEHGIYVTEEIVDEMKKRGTFLVPTLVAPVWVLRRAEREPGSVPPYAVRKCKLVIEDHKKNIAMAIARGATIAMGTDLGVGPHGHNAEELQFMVEAGMTPMQAIVASTQTAAACLRLGDLTGTLQPGKRADLLALDGDPLNDITILQQKDRLKLVMRDGAAFKDALSLATPA